MRRRILSEHGDHPECANAFCRVNAVRVLFVKMRHLEHSVKVSNREVRASRRRCGEVRLLNGVNFLDARYARVRNLMVGWRGS